MTNTESDSGLTRRDALLASLAAAVAVAAGTLPDAKAEAARDVSDALQATPFQLAF